MFNLRSWRPPDQPPGRLAANWLLASAVLAVSMHAAWLPVWLTLTTACFIVWRYLIENHGWRNPGRAIRILLTAAAAIVVYRHYGSLLGRDAGAGLLVMLIGLKLLEMRRPRDHFVALFLVYFLTLTAFLFSQTVATAAAAVGVATVSTATLIHLNHPGGPSTGHALRLSGRVMLQAVPVMIVLYLLFPRIQGSLWGLPYDAYGATVGLPEEVAPGTILRLFEDDTIAFRVEFEGDVPPMGQLYWRARVMAESDGRSWRQSSRPIGWIERMNALRYQPLAPLLRYTITFEPSDKRWLAALDLPAVAPDGTRAQPGFIIQSRQPLRQRKRLSLSSHLLYRTGALSESVRNENLAITRIPSRRVTALVQRWRARSKEPADVIRQALAYFRDEPFHYTLTPPLLGDDPLDSFLFETRAGYCEHYASTFAWLMRLAGIPTRLVVGFQGGQWNDAGGYLIVRQSDAHAWAEAWLNDRGWVRVDPTAAVASERIELGMDALRRLLARGMLLRGLTPELVQSAIAESWWESAWQWTALRWDAVNAAWQRWVISYGPLAQAQLLSALGFQTPTWTQLVATLGLGIGLVVLVVAALILMPRTRRDPVTAAYARFCRRLAKVAPARRPWEGPIAYQRRVVAARPDLADATEPISALYIVLRYGRSDRRRLRELRSLVSRFRPRRQTKPAG